MASAFETLARGAAWEALAAQFGIEVTLYQGEVAAQTVIAIWHPGQQLLDYYQSGTFEAGEGVLRVNPDDLAQAISLDDYFTIDGEAWGVRQIGRRSPFLDLSLRRVAQRQARAVAAK